MKSKKFIYDVLSKEQLQGLMGKSLKEVIENISLMAYTDDELLTRDEACKLLKVDLSTLWRWTNKGLITAYGIGSKRFYKKEELLNSLIQLNSKKLK